MQPLNFYSIMKFIQENLLKVIVFQSHLFWSQNTSQISVHAYMSKFVESAKVEYEIKFLSSVPSGTYLMCYKNSYNGDLFPNPGVVPNPNLLCLRN